MSLTDNHTISESDLIEGCLEGNPRMQELLYRRFSAKMYAVCLRYAGQADDAQDILQDGFVKVFRNLDRFRKEGSFEGWVRRIFINTAIEHYRKSSGHKIVSEPHEYMTEDKSWTVFDKLAAQDLIALIQELAPGYRAVFNLYVVEGYSHKEVSGMLGISEGTSKSQLARAKGILQNLIKEKLNQSY